MNKKNNQSTVFNLFAWLSCLNYPIHVPVYFVGLRGLWLLCLERIHYRFVKIITRRSILSTAVTMNLEIWCVNNGCNVKSCPVFKTWPCTQSVSFLDAFVTDNSFYCCKCINSNIPFRYVTSTRKKQYRTFQAWFTTAVLLTFICFEYQSKT